jgi:hypothetical protein
MATSFSHNSMPTLRKNQDVVCISAAPSEVVMS